MPKPFPFIVYYLFGCHRCGRTYISAWFPENRRMSFFNVSQSAVIPVSRPKACCPDCGIESEQETLVDITCKIIEFEKKIKEAKHENP